MSILTKPEKLAIRRLRAAFTALPRTLRVYVIDDSAGVCKLGVPSTDVYEHVAWGLRPGCVLTDLHDDMDNGQE